MRPHHDRYRSHRRTYLAQRAKRLAVVGDPPKRPGKPVIAGVVGAKRQVAKVQGALGAGGAGR